MKKMTMFVLLLVAAVFAACDNDDNKHKPDEAVTRAFEQKYPEAAQVKWETKKGYEVAEFKIQGKEKEAWFDKDGKWYMTESDMTYEELPGAVKTNFKKDYADWKVEDVDMLERTGMEAVYVIEAEQGKEELDLYYTEDGTLVKTVIDNDGYSPDDVLTPTIKTYLSKHYTGAKIIDAEIDNTITEVDILHDGKYKEVKFDKNEAWLSTEWDVPVNTVPAVVMSAITSGYAGYVIEDVDFVERAQAVSVYRFELEKGDVDLDVLVDEAGNIIK